MGRMLVLWVVVAVSGCAQDSVVPCEGALHEQFVVFAAWHHESVSGASTAGLDLDGVVSDGTAPGCTGEEDFSSWRRDDTGIDNQYAANLLPLLEGQLGRIDPLVLEQLMRGESVFGLGVRVGEDRIPHVALVELAPVDPMIADASGRSLARDQRFRIVHGEWVEARCAGDAIELAWPTLDLPMGDPIVAVPLHDVRLHVAVDRTGALVGGELGARYPLPFVVEVAGLLGIAIDEGTARSITHPDLDPNADASVCESVSFGVAFDVVPATLAP